MAVCTVETLVLLVSMVAMFVAPGALPTSTMYVVAALVPVVGTLVHVTVIVAGLAEVPSAVTDAAAFEGAGGAALQLTP